jgi:hypothetical protein
MPKFAVTAIARSRVTRRRTGKARVEIIDSDTNSLFQTKTAPVKFVPMKDPIDIERAYERFWNDTNPHSRDIVTVIDVREAHDAPITGRFYGSSNIDVVDKE